MASKIVIRNGVATGVYDDRFRPIFEAISGGQLVVKRATEVEYDEASGDWVATLLSTGKVIARGKDRSKVIEEEIRFLETEVIR